MARGSRGAQEEPLRRLSAVVASNSDPFVIEQLHKLELAAGSCVRLNNGGMKSKEAGPGTDSVQLQVEIFEETLRLNKLRKSSSE